MSDRTRADTLKSEEGPAYVPRRKSERPPEDVARAAGRGGLAIAFAKIYFFAQGLLVQVVLPRVLGLAGYGAWSTVSSFASLTYNPILVMSIQGVSRAVAESPPEEQAAALRRTYRVHVALALIFGGGFWVLAPLVARLAGAPHVTEAMRILSGALFLYALYAPLIGALNGQKKFSRQAAFDVLAATVRTIGLVGGAYLFVGRGLAVEGAAAGFVAGLLLVLALALFVVGVGRAGPGGPSVGSHVRFILPVLVGQALLNVLLQADLILLRRFSADAATVAGLPIAAADPLVGAYRAIQLFSYLPYQLLIAVNFVLFPMLATAVRDRDRAAIARYVATGVRIAAILAGLMVSVTSGLSDGLVELVFGAEAAQLGGRSLELLALGFGFFAIFGVVTTALNSLERERQSMAVTAAAVIVVAALCFFRVPGTPFGESLLFRTATATSIGILIATVGAGVLLYRRAGAVIRPVSALRVVLGVAAGVSVGRWLPVHGLFGCVGGSLLVGLVYLLVLLGTRELGPEDLKTALTVVRRQKG